MKNLILVTLFCLILINPLFAKSIHLNEGDQFTYNTSRFDKEHFINPEKDNSDHSENIQVNQVHFEVKEVLPDIGYRVIANFQITKEYRRQRASDDEQWRSGSNYDVDLHAIHANYENPSFTIDFILSDKGELSDAEVLHVSETTNRQAYTDSIILQIGKAYNSFFSTLPKRVKVGHEIKIDKYDFKVKEILNNQVILISTSDSANYQNDVEAIYDLNTGLLLESNVYQKYNGTDFYRRTSRNGILTEVNGTLYKTSLRRTNLIMENTSLFSCKFYKNKQLTDTTFSTTNVTIRGKINNPNQKRKVGINFSESVPNAYNRYSINTDLNDDNTFEIRLYLEKMQKVSFWHHESASLYLSPGDDLYITLDLEEFDETITATGEGSNHVNYSFKKFLFEEQGKLGNRSIYNIARKKYTELEPSAFKAYFLDVLEKKQSFLENNSKWLSPEQYLAEFWENQITIVKILKDYPRKQEYYRKQENMEPFVIDKNDFLDSEFYALIHPDNDMMAYYDGYDHFIREYVFFFLDGKMEELTGKGNVVNVKNYLDYIYQARYGLTNSLFTGVSQYILKYETVSDALQRASWDVFVQMYNQFNSEYPGAYKTNILTEAYEKAKTVAPGELAFDFELSDYDNNKVKLSDYRGKVVYIDFWATNCGPCVGSLKRYGKEMQETFKDEDIVLMYVALEKDVTRPKEFMEEQGIEGIQLIAIGKEEALIRDKYFFSGIPHHYIIDKEGRIVKRQAPSPYQIVKDHSILLNALEPQ